MFIERACILFSLAFAVMGAPSCAQPLPDVGDTDGSTTDDGLPPDSSVTAGEADTSSATAGPMDTMTGDTGVESGCGNGIVEAGETCDDEGESATCDDDCTEVVCGDSNVNVTAGEECEGEDLAGGSCEGLGFDGGTLSCDGGCSYDASGCAYLPVAPVLELSFSQVKQFDFSWGAATDGADYYQLEESIAPGEPFVQLGGDIVGESISVTMPLCFRYEASYRLRACNLTGCTYSSVVDVVGSLAEAVGYLKASNTGEYDVFGDSVALSGDGNTLAVGAGYEASSATGIGGNQVDDSAPNSGAVYVFVRDGMGGWSQQAYVKASNTSQGDRFGYSVALSGDGNTLVVGAYIEDSSATGIGGTQADNSAVDSGAAYVFVRDGMGGWSQQAYVKASNTGGSDRFGYSVALSGDGNTLAIGARDEDSNATGIGGDEIANSATDSGAVYVFGRSAGVWSQQAYVKASNTGPGDRFGISVALSGDGNTLAVGAYGEGGGASASGAVYVFVRDGMGAWLQQAYVKASNTGMSDAFGISVALSGDGNTLAVGAWQEASSATGIGGIQADDSAPGSGAAYVFVRDGVGAWSQQAYVKASNTSLNDLFGWDVALSGDGNILAVGAYAEDSNATGIGGIQADDSASASGAVYVFARNGMGAWSQHTYVKASNTGAGDNFGQGVALSEDGDTLAVVAPIEDSNATGLGGNQANNSAPDAGAVYLY